MVIRKTSHFVIVLAFMLSSTVLQGLAFAKSPYEFTTNEDVIIVGDVHGAYEEFVDILLHAQIVDENLAWIGAKKHLVSVGDLMHRGPASRKVMDLLIRLEKEAASAGGKVHVILGNHEVLSLTGDWRYVSSGEYAEFASQADVKRRDKEYELYKRAMGQTELSRASFDELFPLGFFARLDAFMPNGQYGKWLHELPFLIKINTHLITHGGLSVKTHKHSIASLNTLLKEELKNYTEGWSSMIEGGLMPSSLDSIYRYQYAEQLKKNRQISNFLTTENALLYSLSSPVWYRGNIMCHPLFEEQVLTQALEVFNGSALWVGHTPARTVRQRFDNKLVMIDTGMLKTVYKGKSIYAKLKAASASEVDWSFINADTSETVSLSNVPIRRNINPYGMSDQELEDFLSTAEVTHSQTLGEGITNPKKLTLEKDGKTVFAIFKYFDSESEQGSYKPKNADRYQFETAVYKLDRMMDVNLVPVTVQRKVNSVEGAVQLWIDGLINYKNMKDKDIKYEGFCHYNRQRQMQYVFDYLIRNEDRNQSNIAFTQNDWQLWFIDHTRAFQNKKSRPKMLKNKTWELTPEFRERLEALTQEQLSALSPYLSKRQISGIWMRRNALLSGDA